MSKEFGIGPVSRVLKWAPLTIFILLIASFGTLSPRFLSVANLGAILVQSSWLVVVALGMNFVLLAAGVDLSVGSIMYLAAVTAGMGLVASPAWVVWSGRRWFGAWSAQLTPG